MAARSPNFADPERGLWAASAPPPPETSTLTGAIKADVAIIGAGFTGLSAALHLAESGASVAVLEAQSIGHGGSGRNAGLVNAGLWVTPEGIKDELGEERGERLIAALENAPDLVFDLIERHAIDCEAVREGTLHCAESPSGYRELEDRLDQWRARGAPVELLDRDQAAPAIGSTAYHGALLDRRAGTIQPLGYARGLAHAAVKAGAKIFTGSRVTSCRREKDKWIVNSPAGSVTAGTVIVATNAYSGPPWDELRQSHIPLALFQFATAPLTDNVRETILPGRQGAWDTHQILSWFRMDQAGRLVFGSIGSLDAPSASVHGAWARRAVARLFPQIGAPEFEHGWTGQVAMTPDHLPSYCAPAPGVMAFVNYNGRGIGPGTVFGKAMAEHLLSDRKTPLPMDATPLKSVPFRGLRELSFEAGATAFHGMRGR